MVSASRPLQNRESAMGTASAILPASHTLCTSWAGSREIDGPPESSRISPT